MRVWYPLRGSLGIRDSGIHTDVIERRIRSHMHKQMFFYVSNVCLITIQEKLDLNSVMLFNERLMKNTT